MTVFQLVFLTILSGVILSELWALWRGTGNWRVSAISAATRRASLPVAASTHDAAARFC